MIATASGTYGAPSLAILSTVGAALTIPWPTVEAACPIGLVTFLREKPRFYICKLAFLGLAVKAARFCIYIG